MSAAEMAAKQARSEGGYTHGGCGGFGWEEREGGARCGQLCDKNYLRLSAS